MKSIAFLCLVWLLPAPARAETRDPMWVLLSDNADIGLPRFETGATYISEPAPTNLADFPATTIASPQGGGLGRLQDAGRPNNPDNAALGWNATRAAITFDLKRMYRVEAVELLLMSRAVPRCHPHRV